MGCGIDITWDVKVNKREISALYWTQIFYGSFYPPKDKKMKDISTFYFTIVAFLSQYSVYISKFRLFRILNAELR